MACELILGGARSGKSRAAEQRAAASGLAVTVIATAEALDAEMSARIHRHQVTKRIEMYAAVSNLFDRENGMWVRDDAIYPIDFERTWRLGARVKF